MDDRQQQIRDRAYAIWEAEGQPSGRAEEHWAQAESALDPGASDDPPGYADTVSAIPLDDAPNPVAEVPAPGARPSRAKKAATPTLASSE